MRIKTQKNNNSKNKKKIIKKNKNIFYVLVFFLIFSFGYLSAVTSYVVYKYRDFGLNLMTNLYKNVINFPRTIYSKNFYEHETFIIDIDFENLQKLQKKRKLALNSTYNIKSEDDYVSAVIKYNNKDYKAKIRLKGDGAETHLDGNKKWSIRIKLLDDGRIFGVRKFSIQKPETLNFIYEWLFHKAYSHVGGISKKYKFIKVKWNGDDWGAMAFNEHFGKELLESNGRRSAPIVRFDTDYRVKAIATGAKIWNYADTVSSKQTDSLIYQNFNNQNPLPISHYGRNQINSDEVFKKQFQTASTLLDGWRQGRYDVSEVFDLDKFAKYVALCDIFEGTHGFMDLNMAFYYNPITSKLEPIAEDVHSGIHPFILSISIINGFISSSNILESQNVPNFLWKDYSLYENRTILRSLFKDESFILMYLEYIKKFSKKDFLDNFIDSINDEMKDELHTLYTDYQNYSFNSKKNKLYSIQEIIRLDLNPPTGLLAYLSEYKNNKLILDVGVSQILPVEISSINIDDKEYFLKQKKIFFGKSKYKLVKYQKLEFDLPQDIIFENNEINNIFINYEIIGNDKKYQNKVYSWSSVAEKLKDDVLRERSSYQNFEFVDVDNKNKIIKIKSGKWEINEDLIIPEKYTVIIEKNTSLDLLNSSLILSYSPIEMQGYEDENILITSTDNTGQGLSIINANKNSEFNYVTFENLKNPKKGNWELYGAINLYNSPIDMNNVRFKNIDSEDALNLINTKGKIKNSYFKNLSSDAIDTDFSKLEIENSKFEEIGGDAIDTSGSVVSLSSISINKTKDKGISAGENSQISGKNIKIKNSFIGVAIKDLSNVDCKNLILSENEYAIVAFQKKPEYGPGFANIENIEFLNNKEKFLIEEKSLVKIDNKEILEKKRKGSIKKLIY